MMEQATMTIPLYQNAPLPDPLREDRGWPMNLPAITHDGPLATKGDHPVSVPPDAPGRSRTLLGR